MSASSLTYEINIPVFNLGALSLKDLDQHLHRLVKTERKIMDQVLKVIAEMDLRHGYLQLGFGSLFSYLVGIGYSESAAQRRITASRVLQKMNCSTRLCAEQSLKEGSLNLTQLSKVNSLFDYLEKHEKEGEVIEINTAIPKLLHEIQGQNARTTDAAIENIINTVLLKAKQNKLCDSKKPKIKKHITGKVKITLELSADLSKKLQKVLDLRSHAIPDRNVLTLFEKLLDVEIKKHEGSTKKSQEASVDAYQFSSKQDNSKRECTKKDSAEQVFTRQDHSEKPLRASSSKLNLNKNPDTKQNTHLNTKPAEYKTPTITSATNVNLNLAAKTYPVKNKRKSISIIIKRRVYQKAGYQCEYISPLTGARCSETRFLNLDHIRPLALGGTNDESNFRCICGPHNLAEAQRMGLKIPKQKSKNF